MKFKYSLILILSLYTFLYGQKPMFQEPYSSRIANYEISVKLDPETRKIHGSQILTWRNDSDDYINDLQFHLYLNAFKNELSTFMIESSGRHRGQELDKED
ncbi:MAG: M1 family peptidase, partial [Calditrichia bacterium]|nr:M1 family peptidase [Calditrichia bacterium]